ncbi:MAG: (d)CMP kinase [Planctomycetota bacterium]|jgi:cytidylate kinase
MPGPSHLRRSWDAAARPVRHALFASDMHMHGARPDGVQRGCRFVEHARDSGADALFLLGDIFMAWMGPRSLRDPGLQPFLSSLAEAVAGGMRVVLLHGNHDFLLGPHVEQALGVEVAGHGLDVSLGGQRARLVHGDAFCTNDRSYQRLHRIIRSGPFRAVFRSLPQAASDRVSRTLLDSANRNTNPKPAAMTAMVDQAVTDTLSEGIDLIVCGHVHRARDSRLPAGRGRGEGRLVVMADFETSGSHARWIDGRLELVVRDARFAPEPGPVIAIDGPAGSGKSAASRRLAAALGYGHLDSGALYRAVTWAALGHGTPDEDAALTALARTLNLDIDPSGRLVMNGAEIPDPALRSPEVTGYVSRVSAVPGVREALLDVQRGLARRVPGLVAEGRDIASVVFPEAAHGFYLDARPEVRAARRAAQGEEGGGGASLTEVQAAIDARDRLDSGRAVAPLTQAEGALRVDTSDMDLDQVVEHLLGLVGERVAG